MTSETPETARPGSFPWRKLPGEMKNLIYEQILHADSSLPHIRITSAQSVDRDTLNILHVNQQTRRELLSLLPQWMTLHIGREIHQTALSSAAAIEQACYKPYGGGMLPRCFARPQLRNQLSCTWLDPTRIEHLQIDFLGTNITLDSEVNQDRGFASLMEFLNQTTALRTFTFDYSVTTDLFDMSCDQSNNQQQVWNLKRARHVLSFSLELLKQTRKVHDKLVTLPQFSRFEAHLSILSLAYLFPRYCDTSENLPFEAQCWRLCGLCYKDLSRSPRLNLHVVCTGDSSTDPVEGAWTYIARLPLCPLGTLTNGNQWQYCTREDLDAPIWQGFNDTNRIGPGPISELEQILMERVRISYLHMLEREEVVKLQSAKKQRLRDLKEAWYKEKFYKGTKTPAMKSIAQTLEDYGVLDDDEEHRADFSGLWRF